MSDKSRNSRFTRKSGKNASSGARSKDSKRAEDPARRHSQGSRAHRATSAPKSPKFGQKGSKRKGAGREGGSGWHWGAHACTAILANPRRTIHEILLTEHSAARYSLPKGTISPTIVLPNVIDKVTGRDAAHQGIAIKAAPLEWPDLEVLADTEENGLILVLDQITCLLYTSPSPRDATLARMPSSA